MNGPRSEVSGSIRRHCDMNTSSWPHLVWASRWLSATIFALFFRMAAISFRFWMIMLSRVTIAIPGGHLGYPVRVEHIRACDGARCPAPLVDDGPGVPGIRDVVAETAEDLAEPEDVSVDIEAHLRRPQAHATARCDNS
jgi:hypothetical protein